MKKIILPFIALLLLLSGTAWGQIEKVYTSPDGMLEYWSLNLKAKTLVVYSAREADRITSKCKGDIVVPEKVTYTPVGAPAPEEWTVTQIGETAFAYGKEITSIKLPPSIVKIERYAFQDCDKIKTLEIGPKVTSITLPITQGCLSLESITVAAGNTDYVSKDDVLYNIYKEGFGVAPEKVGKPRLLYVYPANRAGETYAVEEPTTALEVSSFYGAKNLTTVTFPSSTIMIKTMAFAYAEKLTTITIPTTILTVGSSSTDGALVFYGCKNLKEIRVEDGHARYVSDGGILYNNTQTILFAYPAAKEQESYQVAETATKIDQGAFGFCKVKSVKIGKDVKTIGASAFSRSPRLEELVLSDENTSFKIIGGALYNARLTTLLAWPGAKGGEILIPKGVTTIEQEAFAESKIETVSLPTTMRSINLLAFEKTTALKTIYNPTPSPASFSLGGGVFDGLDKTTTVWVPKGAKEAYDKAAPWNAMTISEFKEPTSVKITTKPTGDLKVTETFAFVASVAPKEASQLVTWSITTDPEGVAEIDPSSGELEALKAGKVTVTATCLENEKLTDKVEVNVIWQTPTAIKITNLPEKDLFVGDTITLTATITPKGTNPKAVEWSVAPVENAKIDPKTGKLEALKAGKVTVTAKATEGTKVTTTGEINIAQPATSVVIACEKEVKVLTVDGTAQFSVTVEPKDAPQAVTWSVTPNTLGTITADGLFTATKEGNATIHATSANGTESNGYEIRIYNVAKEIKVTVPATTYIGQPVPIMAEVMPEGSSQEVTWKIEPEGSAEIKDGQFIPTKVGKVTITATSKLETSISGKAETQIAKPIESIAISGAPKTMTVGEEATLTLEINPDDATLDITWTSDPASAVTFSKVDDKTTKIIAQKPGEVVITASNVDGKSASTDPITIRAISPKATSIIISGIPNELVVGKSVTLTARVEPQDALQEVTWSVSPDGLAAFEGNVLTAKAIGSVTVMATSVSTPEVTASKTLDIVDSKSTPVASERDNLRVGIDGRTIRIYDVAGQPVALFSVTGEQLHATPAASTSPYEVRVSQPGLYIIRVGNTTRRVVIQ